MTAVGKVPPAKVLVVSFANIHILKSKILTEDILLGTGVAGLAAIQTKKRTSGKYGGYIFRSSIWRRWKWSRLVWT